MPRDNVRSITVPTIRQLENILRFTECHFSECPPHHLWTMTRVCDLPDMGALWKGKQACIETTTAKELRRRWRRRCRSLSRLRYLTRLSELLALLAACFISLSRAALVKAGFSGTVRFLVRDEFQYPRIFPSVFPAKYAAHAILNSYILFILWPSYVFVQFRLT